jgi:hypothetical protein
MMIAALTALGPKVVLTYITVLMDYQRSIIGIFILAAGIYL